MTGYPWSSYSAEAVGLAPAAPFTAAAPPPPPPRIPVEAEAGA